MRLHVSHHHNIRSLKHSGLIQSHVLPCPGLFNLRGSDIDYNPVFFAYAIVTLSDVRYTHTPVTHTSPPQPHTHLTTSTPHTWHNEPSPLHRLFTDEERINEGVRQHLGGEEGVRVFPYNTVAGQITDLLRETAGKVWVREREGGR